MSRWRRVSSPRSRPSSHPNSGLTDERSSPTGGGRPSRPPPVALAPLFAVIGGRYHDDAASRRLRVPDHPHSPGDHMAVERLETATSHLPPHDLEAEQSVLGAMLVNPNAITAVAESLSADDFYRDTHRLIYRAVLI